MAYLNKVLLIGNLTRDPEVRYTPSGTAVADLGLAVSRRYRTEGGEDREEVCFVNLVVWGKQAEAAGKYLKKGRPIFAEGRLQYDTWEKNGEKRSTLKVNCERIQFLGTSGKESGGGAGPAEPRAAPSEPAGEPKSAGSNEMENDDVPF
ncbi:MAG: single-stranded DNA-binding protein [Verrucomicrobiae bacterium]|nr:single-stranded DNA-binding protein [Verrucomicrobiae bacterium]